MSGSTIPFQRMREQPAAAPRDCEFIISSRQPGPCVRSVFVSGRGMLVSVSLADQFVGCSVFWNFNDW